MKTIKSRLLSLLLAMAMILTLAPTALAAGETVTLTGAAISGATTGKKVNETYSLSITPTPASPSGTLEYAWSVTEGDIAVNSSGVVSCTNISSTTDVTGKVKCVVTQKVANTTDVTVTAPEVTVTFTGIPAQPVTPVATTLELGAPSPATLTAGTGTSKVIATVKDADRQPMAGVSVSATLKAGSTATGASAQAGTTGANGTVEITVTPGNVAGTATFSVSAGQGAGLNSEFSVTVNPASVPATNIAMATTNKTTVTVGEKNIVWTAVLTPANATDKPTWTSSDPTVATINPSTGAITALKAGTTEITAMISQTVKAAAFLTVEAAPQALKAELSTPNPATIYSGADPRSTTTTLTITGDAAGYDVTVSASDKSVSVARINQTNNWQITAATDVTTKKTVTIQAVLKKTGAADVKSNAITVTVSPAITYTAGASSGSPNNKITYLDNWTDNNNAGFRDFGIGVNASEKGAPLTTLPTGTSYQWYLNNVAISGATSSTYRLYTYTSGLKYSNQQNLLRCDVILNNTVRASVEWDVRTGYAANAYATATVSISTNSYALGDVDDVGKQSIAGQLDSYFYSTTNSRYGLYYVTFGSNRDGNNGSLSATVGTAYYADRQGSGVNARYLSDVLFYPGTSKTTATFPATFYYYTQSNYNTNTVASVSGSITFNITEGAATGDIVYTATLGEDVYFNVRDFEDFYYNATKGSLNYVTFTLPSGGTLYSDRSRLTTNNLCYVSPRSNEIDLNGVYFTPTGTTATRASTVRISFTAVGTRTNRTGTVAITYLSGNAKDITYNVNSNNTVSLKASDFTDAYRQVVGSTAPSGLTIQFQGVPSNGTLTYKDSSRTNSTAVTLRAGNIKGYKFTTRSTGSNQLGDVSYSVSGSKGDTIEYIAYVNNTPQFTGKVVFSGSNVSASNMQVGFTSSNGQAVSFSYAEFSRANAVVMASCSYIRFVVLPTNGTLTFNGTPVALATTSVAPSQLGSVTYRPNAGFNNNTDRMTFVCYDANGGTVGGGQVSVIVTGNNSSSITVDKFGDVAANAWYRSDLSTLVNAGIIKGGSDGKFHPRSELTYGEALKIFLLASGCDPQQEPAGKDWAINYKNLAVSKGWIGSDVNLSAKISRNAMAELAARSLNIGSSSSASPWNDGSANGYAIALYYTSPQILKGNAEGAFKGNSTLERAEICAIAARVLSYRSNQQSQQRPDWLG